MGTLNYVGAWSRCFGRRETSSGLVAVRKLTRLRLMVYMQTNTPRYHVNSSKILRPMMQGTAAVIKVNVGVWGVVCKITSPAQCHHRLWPTFHLEFSVTWKAILEIHPLSHWWDKMALSQCVALLGCVQLAMAV